MKVATLEKFHLRGGGNQDPGDPGVGKVRGERIFFPSSRGGTDPGWHCYIYNICAPCCSRQFVHSDIVFCFPYPVDKMALLSLLASKYITVMST